MTTHDKTLRTIILSALSILFLYPAAAQQSVPRYRVAACDWMMLKRQKLGEFKLASEINADGVEMDMGGLGNRVLFDNQLRDASQAEKFRQTADSVGVVVCSVAMSGFFAQSFLTRDNYVALIEDCFLTMRKFGSKVAFLPLGGSGREWVVPGAARDTLVARLHTVGEMAVKEGVTIGIRTALDAKANIRLLKEIRSEGIKIYYNFQDAADNNRDICHELKQLGKERVIQIHASNTDGVNLKDDPEIDMIKIKKTLDSMDWSGWLVVERSRDTKRVRDVKYNFGNNVRYLKNIFCE